MIQFAPARGEQSPRNAGTKFDVCVDFSAAGFPCLCYPAAPLPREFASVEKYLKGSVYAARQGLTAQARRHIQKALSLIHSTGTPPASPPGYLIKFFKGIALANAGALSSRHGRNQVTQELARSYRYLRDSTLAAPELKRRVGLLLGQHLDQEGNTIAARQLFERLSRRSATTARVPASALAAHAELARLDLLANDFAGATAHVTAVF